MRLHPEMAEALAGLEPLVRDCTPLLQQLAREGRTALPVPPTASDTARCGDVQIHTHTVGQRGDGSPLRVRIYRGPGETDQPALVYLHGGGFVFGTPADEDARCIRYAREAACTVLSVDYRLAPEHPYPAGLDDCLLAWRAIASQASELGLDPNRLALGGASAGGGLAAATAIALRDQEDTPPLLQLLIYPVLDDRLDTPSMQAFVDTPVWNRETARLAWQMYLGRAAASPVPDYAAPARTENLCGLPATYLLTAEYDPLRDEALHYGFRLLSQGVAVELHNYPGTLHGFDVLAAGTTLAETAMGEQILVLGNAFRAGAPAT